MMIFVMMAGNWWRDRFSKDKLKALRELHFEKKIPSRMFGAKIGVSVGGANCNDLVMFARQLFFSIEKIYSVDPKVAPYQGFTEEDSCPRVIHIPKRIQSVTCVDLPIGEDRLFESFNTAQEHKTDEDKLLFFLTIVTQMREGEYFLFGDEIRISGWRYRYDRFMHYFYNSKGLWDFLVHIVNQKLIDGYWIKDSIESYQALARKTGLEPVKGAARLHHRRSFVDIYMKPYKA
jgi:hypothetical protein